VLAELGKAGIADQDITVFLALGTHRQMTAGEIASRCTPAVAARYRVVNPDWHDSAAYRLTGHTTRGFPIRIHREILDSDFVISVGQTIPHLFAGFGGGGKIINPGCAEPATIGEMHWLCTTVPDGGLYGVRENPVRDTIDEVALAAGLRFIINEVPAGCGGGGGGVAGVFAGHPVLAHRRACECARRACEVPLRELADIVVADAYPADIDFWQAIKGLNAVAGAVRDGGTIILVTPCPEGISSQHPEVLGIGYVPIDELRRRVETGEIDKVVAGNLYVGRKVLDRASVFLITRGVSERDTRRMGIDWAPDPAAALRLALQRHGESASINVLYKAAEMVCTTR